MSSEKFKKFSIWWAQKFSNFDYWELRNMQLNHFFGTLKSWPIALQFYSQVVIEIRLCFGGLWQLKYKVIFKCRECFGILLSTAFQFTLKLCDYHEKWQWKLSLKRPTPLWKILLDQKEILDPNPLKTQLSQLPMVHIKLSQWPLDREFPKFFKTHPTFVCR